MRPAWRGYGEETTRRIAAMCSGPEAQQPPTIWAPGAEPLGCEPGDARRVVVRRLDDVRPAAGPLVAEHGAVGDGSGGIVPEVGIAADDAAVRRAQQRQAGRDRLRVAAHQQYAGNGSRAQRRHQVGERLAVLHAAVGVEVPYPNEIPAGRCRPRRRTRPHTRRRSPGIRTRCSPRRTAPGGVRGPPSLPGTRPFRDARRRRSDHRCRGPAAPEARCRRPHIRSLRAVRGRPRRAPAARLPPRRWHTPATDPAYRRSRGASDWSRNCCW